MGLKAGVRDILRGVLPSSHTAAPEEAAVCGDRTCVLVFGVCTAPWRGAGIVWAGPGRDGESCVSVKGRWSSRVPAAEVVEAGR